MKEKNFLDEEEGKLFFKNWLGLLSFVNDKYEIVEDFNHPTEPIGLNTDDIFKLRDKLWADTSIIDDYLKTNELDSESFEIVDSWKRFNKNSFVFLKELKKHCIVLDEEIDVVYGVKGISNPISEIIPNFPAICEVILIPFKDKIVYDTLIEGYPFVSIGPNMTKGFNDKYRRIKKEKGIKTRL